MWQVAGVSLRGRAARCSYPSMLSLCTRWQHPSIIASGDLAQATKKLIALGYSHCNGAINSQYHCIFNFVFVSPQPHILNILFCHHIFMVGADFALITVQHLHFTFPPSEIRANTLAIQLLCSELQSWLFMLLTKWCFWLGITAVKLISVPYTS